MPTSPDYGVHKVANTTLPLVSPGTQSLLQDADPALFWMLDFWASILATYIGTRLVSAAGAMAAPLSPVITQAVMQRYPWDPSDFLQDGQFQFPLLAAWRQQSDATQLTAACEHDKSVFGGAYILPPLNAGQMESLSPILSAAWKTIRKLTTQGFDPSYFPGGASSATPGPWSVAYAGIEEIGLRRVRWGRLQNTGTLIFPGVSWELDCYERDMYAETGIADKFAGADVEEDLAADDQTVVPNLINISTQQAPTVASLSVTAGPIAGGTSTNLTGTLFLAGAKVYFGNIDQAHQATGVVVNSATSITCVSPAVSGAGTVPVTVVNP